jgi:aspartyl protease family protein
MRWCWLSLRCVWWFGLVALAVNFLVVPDEAAPVAKPRAAIPDKAPPPVATVPGLRLVLEGDHYDQCYVELFANGAKFTALVDTGASLVSFGPQHVAALGLVPSALRYDHLISTANGIGRAAEIQLKELRIGDFVVRDVEAHVDQGGLATPLLGVSVLKLLRLEYANGSCVLTLPAQPERPHLSNRHGLRLTRGN